MSDFYLFSNPPAVSQGRSPRRSKASGVIVFHTDEAPQQPGGALGTAGFISRRRDYGCYHVIADSTNAVRMLPPIEWETWGAASPADTNTHAIHVAFRGQASRWGRDPSYDENAINIMGREVAHILKLLHGDNAYKYVRWISRQDCINRIPGFVEHGTIQPGDRSDPWVGRGDQNSLRDRISKAVMKNLIQVPVPEGVDPTVEKPVMMRNSKDGTISLFYPNTPWRVDLRASDVDKLRFMGIEFKGNFDPWFWEISSAVKVAGR
jgi:hypothetical protein